MLLFFTLVLLMALVYYYHHIIMYPPQSIHRWRQTDSASITLNLYQHGMHFFTPEVHSLTADDLKTGYAAAEAPILYYLIALLYKIFGPHDAVYRITNTLIFMSGLGALFCMARHFLRSLIPSAMVALLVFVSPAGVYYGNNFLTDTTALSMVYMGWWQFIRYQRHNRQTGFIFCVICFTLASLLKATMMLNLFALAALLVFSWMKIVRTKDKFMRVSWGTLAPIFISFLLVAAWYAYAIHFNHVHQSSTFLTSITPWWRVEPAILQNITKTIIHQNLTQYLSSGLWYFMALAVLCACILYRHIPRYILIITIMLLSGSVVYVNLYFNQFMYHDYYILVLFSTFPFILLCSFMAFKGRFPGLFSSWYFSLALFILLIVNVIHARREMTLRYYGMKRETPVYESFFSIQPFLRSIGIGSGDRVISLPDATNCYTLYLMNQPGNTIRAVNGDTPALIGTLIERGAKYLIVSDSSCLVDKGMAPFTKCKIGSYRDAIVFKLMDCPDSATVVP
jgi:4-amino-4-deoxy-L-arabinose transferase-like glycosyltransferase